MLTNLIEPGHLIPILLIALLIFGPKKLPELGRSLGSSIREFRKGTQGLKNEFEDALKTDDEANPTPLPTTADQQTVIRTAPLAVEAQPQQSRGK